MNFFVAQEQARKQTVWLITLFSIAVVILVAITNICVAFFVLYSNPEYALNGTDAIGDSRGNVFLWVENLVAALGVTRFIWVSILVIGGISLAIFFKWLEVREGGRAIAESLGGREILVNTRSARERRLLNIVEEVALAAGVPAPAVFLLEREEGINAFAAGLTPEDAVIGVTHGCLSKLNRDQLQGVIAHEFSHILNGDMKLNMNLLVVLHGIVLISESGRLFMHIASESGRHRHRGRSGGVVISLFLLGVVVWLIGSIGQLFGRIIKSAVSRQREFLADASAVQFTRNPQGIGEALCVIGGMTESSKLQNRHANEMSHLFFSSSHGIKSFWKGFFATHPPLEERINRVWPAWKGHFMDAPVEFEQDIEQENRAAISAFNSEIGEGASTGSVDKFATRSDQSEVQPELPPIEYERPIDYYYDELRKLAHEPSEVSVLIFALLLDANGDIRNKQLKLLEGKEQRYIDKLQGIYEKLSTLDEVAQLSILELAVPSLRQHSKTQYIALRALFQSMIHVDGKIDLKEWLFVQLLKQYCDRSFGLTKSIKAKFKNISQVSKQIELVLSRVVYAGNHSSSEDAFNAGCEAAGLSGLCLISPRECETKSFSQSLYVLARTYPLLKPRIIKALIASAKHNDEVNTREWSLVRGVAAVLDCPLVGFDLSV